MIRALRDKLGKEIEELSHELTVTLPKAIATAVEMGDLRENSEYKAALERQQLVQARLSQLHQRLQQVMQLSTTNSSPDKVGLGSTVVVKDVKTGEKETFMVVLAEMQHHRDLRLLLGMGRDHAAIIAHRAGQPRETGG